MPTCPICSRDAEFSITPFKNIGRHAHPIFDGIELATCSSCRSSWATNPPSQSDLGVYYSSHYAPARVEVDALLARPWPQRDPRATSLITLGRLFGHFSPASVFLDIGPGNGAALAAARYMLPRPKLACVEYNDKTIALFREKLGDIFVSQSVECVLDAFGPQGVHFIYSAHCFEHFPIAELRRTLRMLRAMLADDGVLSLEVPQASVDKLRKARANVPHLIFFSSPGLKALLRSCGFEVELCVETLGRSKAGNAYVAEQLQRSDPEVPEAFARNVSAFNSGDWIGSRPGLVIKCVVTNARQSAAPAGA